MVFTSTSQSIVKYSATKILKYRAKDLYGIVSNVNDYDKFLPLVSKSTVKSSAIVFKSGNGHRITRQLATLDVGSSSLPVSLAAFSYDSQVTLEERISGLELYKAKASCENHLLFASLNAQWTMLANVPVKDINWSSVETKDFAQILKQYSSQEKNVEDIKESVVRYEMQVDLRNALMSQLWKQQMNGRDDFINAFEKRARQLLDK